MLEGAEHVDAGRLVGRRLGEFVVTEALSSGGFGMVFRAEQAALAREAVIKVMHTKLRASETLVQRFLREARLASRLDHPYAAHIYAFGAETDGVLWIAMELVRGTPLDKLLAAQGPLPLERFVPLLERLCQVVQTAHDQGIVHRDLKPANVMVLSRAGQLLPKLLDLGIAKPAEEDLPGPRTGKLSDLADTDVDETDDAFAATATPLPTADTDGAGRLTEEGAIMGSPLYMAPEQWLDASSADARTDIYALAVLSYEALTGQPPFKGASRYLIAMAHAQQEPPKLGRDLPEALDAVLARALAKEPADRFGSALELAAAFRQASGLVEEPVGLPRLPEELRIAVAAKAPQPIAQAASALEAARNPHQARDAVWQLVRVVVRTVAMVALAAHAHVAGARADSRATDAIRRLRRRALPDAEWLAITRELVAPFAKLRDAHPIPELVDFIATATAVTDLLALRDTSDGGATDAAVRELLATAMPLVEKMLGEVAFLSVYRLVVQGERGAELWMGVRRSDPPTVALRGRPLANDDAALLDASGLPIVKLAPFVQVHEPARGLGARLFELEGDGRRGARLVALPESFEHEDDTLWEAIGALAEDASTTTSGQEECPYPGLSAFTADDADRFFGRERESEELVNRLRSQPLLAVVGPSGAGKSSFVQAGVVPLLPEDWEVVVLRPGSAPLASLAARVGKLGLDPVTIRRELDDDPTKLAARLHARGKTTVLVVDQLEELFTLCDDERERAKFAQALVAAARTVDDPVRVILTLRDDFLLHAEALPALRARLAPALHLLTTPDRDDLMRIVLEPLRRAGYELDDPALAGDMVDALAHTRSALALLSFTATKLWELRDRRFRQLTRKAYVSLGGIGGALARHAEATLDAMSSDEQRLVREVFRHAVTAEGTRSVLSRAELDQLLGDERHGPHVIEKLVAARLLVSSEGPDGVEQIEITHEALIEAWPRLVTWRSEDAQGVRLRDQLRTIARQWDDRGRPTGLLWRGDALAEYRLWRSRYPGSLTDVETAFATASLSDAARSQRRQRVLLVTSFGVLTAGMIALIALNRRVADERAVAQTSEADAKQQAAKLHDNLLESYEGQARQYVLGGDYERALTYLDASAHLGASGPAHDLLLAFTANGLMGKQRVLKHDSVLNDARFSPDGTRLATAEVANRARLWSVADGKMLAELPHGAAVETARFLPDGTVVTASEDGTAVLWDGGGKKLVTFAMTPGAKLSTAVPSPDGTLIATVSTQDAVWLWDRTGKRIFELRAPTTANEGPQFARPCAFSADGSRFAVGDQHGTLRVWDPHTGRLVGATAGHTAQINTVEFARSGARIVTASDDGTAIVWDAATVQPLLRVRHEDGVLAAQFSPDETTFATSSNDHSAKVWNAKTGERLLALDGHIAGVNAIEYSPDGRQLATASDDAAVMLWDARTGRRESRLVGHAGAINTLHYDATGTHVVTASSDHAAILWTAVPQQRATDLLGHAGRVYGADISPDGALAITAGADATVRLWQRDTGKQLAILPLDAAIACCAAFSPDGATIATGDNHGLTLWGTTTRVATHTFPAQDMVDIAWSHDGTRIVTANGGEEVARVCSKDGAVIATLHTSGGAVQSATFTPDSRRVVTVTYDSTTQVWDAASGAEITRWKNGFDRVRLDPRGELMVARRALSAVISLASDPKQDPIARLDHDGTVLDVEWSSHGDFLVSASIDGKVRIWDRGGHLLVALGDGHSAWWRARFSPDDRYVISGSVNGVQVWELPRFSGSYEELMRCRQYDLEGTQLRPAKRPADCT